jgi:hypothetical protein
MFDIVYDFLLNEFLATTMTGAYIDQLALLLTHITMWLMYLLMVRLVVWSFNIFRGIATW